eukprot:scaffold23767_cov62-Phaeocystis_antarctica.AAC.8
MMPSGHTMMHTRPLRINHNGPTRNSGHTLTPTSAIRAAYCGAALARGRTLGRCPLRLPRAQRRRNDLLDRVGPLLELSSEESSDRITLVLVRDDRELQPRCNLVVQPDNGNLAHDVLGLLVGQSAARTAINTLRV